MDDSERRRQLEQQLEEVDRKLRAAMREEHAAAREAEKFPQRATEPLDPFEDREGALPDAMMAAFKRKQETAAKARRLTQEKHRLVQELNKLR